MPRTQATISVVSHTPDHGDGTTHMGDTVTYAIDPPDSGVITAYGSRNGSILVSWANFRGDLDMTLGPSAAYLADPGPLDVSVTLSELVHHKVQVIAETTFEIKA